MALPLLAAALIVKDESATLPECFDALRALHPLLDHVVVYDTGSTDDSRELARAAGARVVEGFWDDDFSRARNAAVELTAARWVLSVDADERPVADLDRLADALEAGLHRRTELDALWIPLVNIAPDGSEMYAVPLGRIFRPDRARFAGRLHEQVEALHPARGELRFAEAPRDVVHLRHVGYRDPLVVRRKAERNLRIVGPELDVLEDRARAADPDLDRGALARALYHRGRTLLTAGRVAEARADLERLLEVPVRIPEQSWGRDVLAQLLLATGEPGRVAALAGRLRTDGVDPGYCGWLEAQALLAEHRYADALPLLRGAERLVDAVGRQHDVTPVLEAQMIAAARTGLVDEAAAVCIRLMAGRGRTDGLGTLLLTLWGQRPEEWLVELLSGADGGHLPAVCAELQRCPAPGPSVAAALAGAHPRETGGRLRAAQPATSSAAPSS